MSVYDEIQKERDRQDQKWGEQNHHPIEWLIILGEEFGEACRGGCEAHWHADEHTYDKYREELIHVAAVAVAAIESLDRNNG